jgi:queuosine precursor transporter
MKTTLTLAAAYLASVVAAAYAVTHIGTQYFPGAPHVVPVWPGIDAPSGVYVIGVTLVIRDLLQHRISKPVMVSLIVAGAGLAALVSPAVAVASGCAFLLSETVDWAVYTLTEKRIGDLGAILASNAVSIVVDSIVFLTVAFGSLAFLEGQVIGKALATLAAFAVIVALRVGRKALAT